MRAEPARSAVRPPVLFTAWLVLAAFPAIVAAAERMPPIDWANATSASRMLVVAISDKPEPVLAPGATPRAYAGLPAYSGGARAKAASARIARDYGLREISAWTIAALRLRCSVLEAPTTAERDALLVRLAGDRRIRLAQPLQEFATLAMPAPAARGAGGGGEDARYNDPYFRLQHNLAAIDGANAQRWTRGEGVRIAVIDAGVDATHADLRERIAEQRDFVAAGAGTDVGTGERHGTEVAGAIGAVADNGLGIVGVAPGARLHAYRACWSVRAASDARCNTYTLALALGAAIDAEVRIINLSLGGPPDPLLGELVGHAIDRGILVVGALPPGGHADGFPLAVAGVVAVGSAGDAAVPVGGIKAPGRDILTLQPGGGFDYASGSSLAAAQVSGALALLLALRPGRNATALIDVLARSRGPDGVINACMAVAELRKADGHCRATPARSAPVAGSGS